MTESAGAAAREELVRRRLFTASGQASGPPTVPRGSRPELSFAQRRLWFIEQLQPGNPAYIIPVAYRIRGQLRVPDLERALAAVVERHESLRTRFEVLDGEPYQVITAGESKLPVEELAADSAIPPLERARAITMAEAVTPFDLTRGPLFRARLLRLAAGDHILLLTAHHTVFDAWSLDILVREIGELYRVSVIGVASNLAPLSIQYADFAAWQRRELTEGRLAEHTAYWRRQLADVPPVLELPTDHPRPAELSYRGGSVSFDIPAETVRGLRALAQQRRATLYAVTLAAFQALLGRYAGVSDLVLGSSVSGRDRVDFEGLIGFFVDSLPLRVGLAGNPTFADLVDQVRETVLDAFSYQGVPFEHVVDALSPQRELNRNPVVQVWFNLITTTPGHDLGELRLSGLDVETFDCGVATTRFDLELHLFDAGPDRVNGGLIYAEDLFDHRTMASFAGHYRNFLAAVARDPTTPISRVPIVTPGELALLARWNGRSDQPTRERNHDARRDSATVRSGR